MGICGMVTLTIVVYMHMISESKPSLLVHRLDFPKVHLVGPNFFYVNLVTCLPAPHFQNYSKYGPGTLSCSEY